MHRFAARLILFLVGVALFGLMAGSASAQGVPPIPIDPPIPVEPPWPWPPEPVPPVFFPVTVEQHTVDATIEGPVATVTVRQLFRNDSGRLSEGVYVFPLPADAAPSSFQMTIDGQVVEGSLYDADEARAIYEEIVRSLRDPALLEWSGRGLFQVSVFPIPAGESREVELTYEHPVEVRDGIYRFSVPLKAYVPGASPAETVAVAVELEDQPGLRTIYSPSHDVSIDRTGDDGALVGFEGRGKDTQSDFTLYFGTDESAIGANLLSYKPAGEDGFFLLLAAPSLDAAEVELVARDIVLVLDVSGSMQGEKIEQARAAARYVVDQLNPGDRFNILTFSTGVNFWERRLQEVDATTLADAQEWIDEIVARGSTDINRGLLEGLHQIRLSGEEGRPAYILFMTDGLPTVGETDPEQIIKNVMDDAVEELDVRLFTFGVGYDVNTDLLNSLSVDLRGRSTYVRPEEAIDEVVGDFYAQIGKPVLSGVELDLGDEMLIEEVYPYPLPDLFAGEQMVVVGRYRDGGDVTLTLRGEVNGRPVTYRYPGHVLAEAGGEPFVARLWATRKIGLLLEQIRRDGPEQELIDEIIDLSLAYGIVTPYTSYLVLEPGMEAPVVMDAGAAMEAGASLHADAYQVGGGALDAAAAAPAAGEAAVAAAEVRSGLQNAANVQEQSQVRAIAGKTFIQRGWVETPDGSAVAFWVDTAFGDESETETVEFASERYFELIEDATVAQWLSLSSEMLLVLEDGSAVRITNAAE